MKLWVSMKETMHLVQRQQMHINKMVREAVATKKPHIVL